MKTLVLTLLMITAIASDGWKVRSEPTAAPIRFITSTEGRLIGGRFGNSHHSIGSWESKDSGRTWSLVGSVLGEENKTVVGDICFLGDGGKTVYCAYRERIDKSWQVSLSRSDDSGRTWVFDSVVARNDENRFMGAPTLVFSRDGNLLCFYDSEKAPADAGFPGGQWIEVKARPRLDAGKPWSSITAIACRPENPSTFARDGTPTVVLLDGPSMLMVVEGVDPVDRDVNALYSIKSSDHGRTWDFKSRQKIWAPKKNGRLFNAYVPMALRLTSGEVAVVFATDDDFDRPSLDSLPPHIRRAHIKMIRSKDFESWGELETVDDGQDSMYTPGLIELPDRTLLCTTDYYGKQSIRESRIGVK